MDDYTEMDSERMFGNTLPYDVTRCMTDGCCLESLCFRKSPLIEGRQGSMSIFDGGTDCGFFIPNPKEEGNAL